MTETDAAQRSAAEIEAKRQNMHGSVHRWSLHTRRSKSNECFISYAVAILTRIYSLSYALRIASIAQKKLVNYHPNLDTTTCYT